MDQDMHAPRGRPEPDRTRVGAVLIVAGGIALLALTAGIISVRFAHAYRADGAGAEPAPLVTPPYGERRSAHWQNPQGELLQLKAQYRTRLEGYRWLDRPAGVVQIPIERAMELIAARSARERPQSLPAATEQQP
jgi:hypothetical protein